MKYSFKIQKLVLALFIISSCLAKEAPELQDIYITEQKESYTLVMEFSSMNFDYVVNENFAPPSITLALKNVKWKRGNFTKKSSDTPLYQYGISIPRNDNQKQIRKRLVLKMDFTRVPDYEIKLDPGKKKAKKHKLKIVWKKI